MLKIKFGGLYWPADVVQRVLAPRPETSEPLRIIDIGTGSGTFVHMNLAALLLTMNDKAHGRSTLRTSFRKQRLLGLT